MTIIVGLIEVKVKRKIPYNLIMVRQIMQFAETFELRKNRI
jgi:hypothetical protein